MSVGGLLAGAIFKKIWKLAAGEDEAPKATDASRGWREILTAAALQGAIFAVVRAARWTASPRRHPVAHRDLAGRGEQCTDIKKEQKA